MTPRKTAPAAEAAEAELARLRARLDDTDGRVMDTVAERLRICDEIGAVKRRHGVAMMQPGRITHVTAAYAAHAVERGLSSGFGEDLARLLIDEACRRETEIIDGGRS